MTSVCFEVVTGITAVPTEADLVDSTLAGDTAAFASLYRNNVAAVTRVVRDGISDPEAAADLVQDVFVKALERLGNLRERDRFRPWLLSIARNTVVDRYRSGGRSRTSSLDAEAAAEPVAGGPTADELAELADLARLVAGCVAGLSSRDATALSMVTHLGLGPVEVAVALGVSRDTAKVIVHRARRRLRDALSLELMVRRKGPGCPELDALGTDDVAGALRHVRSCPACAELVEAEVQLYGSEPEALDPHPGIS